VSFCGFRLIFDEFCLFEICDRGFLACFLMDLVGIRLSVKKKPVKAKKDPNKPKRPPSAFFVFM